MNERVTVCCILVGDWPGATEQVRAKVPGGDLGAHYVRQLKGMVDKYAPPGQEYSFTCFTDRAKISGVECKPLHKGVWGFFNKLQLFSAETIPNGERVLLLDLDTCIVGHWAELASVDITRPVMLRDVWHGLPASGVMTWRQSPELAVMWNEFVPQAHLPPPYDHPRRPAIEVRTDEQWIIPFIAGDRQGGKWTAWQDVLPDKLFSFKYHIQGAMQKAKVMTAEQARRAVILYFHGTPRPHTVPAPWNPHYVEVRERV